MFRIKCTDPFNLQNNRNIHNTNKRFYNCAGYALGTFSWYCPHSELEDFLGFDYSFNSINEANDITNFCVNTMIIEFDGRLRVIDSLEELDTKNERVIAFRISSDGDFHFIKKGANGQWYEKMGWLSYIHTMDEDWVLHSVWHNTYDGPIVLLAMKK